MLIVIVPLIFRYPASKAAEVQLSPTNSAPLNYVDYSAVYSAVVLENSREPDMFLDGQYRNCPPDARRCTESVVQQTLVADCCQTTSTSAYVFVIITLLFLAITLLSLYWPANPLQNCATEIPMLIRITYLIETH